MSWFGVISITLGSVFAGTSLCFYLLRKTNDVDSTNWIIQHIACPIFRTLVLIIIVGLVYSLISDSSGSNSFWEVIFRQNRFNHVINVLFFGSLILGFLPLVDHPVFSLPIQSCLTVALVFNWEFGHLTEQPIIFLPGITVLVKISLFMVAAYFLTGEISVGISRWLDRKFHISGSILLVADAVYLVLQIPLIWMYCNYLKAQLAIS
jgi:hypothetical protein